MRTLGLARAGVAALVSAACAASPPAGGPPPAAPPSPPVPASAPPVAEAPNPLLTKWSGPYGGVPPFSKVKVDQFKPALEAAMNLKRAEIAVIAGSSAAPTFENTIAALEDAGRTLDEELWHELAGSFADLDMSLYMHVLELLGEHDASDVLPDVDVPVLVIAGDRDLFTPRSAAERMVREISGAELMVVPGGTHYVAVEQPELVNLRIEKFFGERGYPPAQTQSAAAGA